MMKREIEKCWETNGNCEDVSLMSTLRVSNGNPSNHLFGTDLCRPVISPARSGIIKSGV